MNLEESFVGFGFCCDYFIVGLDAPLFLFFFLFGRSGLGCRLSGFVLFLLLLSE